MDFSFEGMVACALGLGFLIQLVVLVNASVTIDQLKSRCEMLEEFNERAMRILQDIEKHSQPPRIRT